MNWNPYEDPDPTVIDDDGLSDMQTSILDQLAAEHHNCHGLPHCEGCGCCALHPCPGGCIWATDQLCSKCL